MGAGDGVGAQEMAEGHAGQSFRLACLSGKNPGGSKDPRLLRDRPTDGAALVSKIWACAGDGGGSCGSVFQTGSP